MIGVLHANPCRSCVALVSAGRTARLGHIRRRSEVTVAVRRGWAWAGVTGAADLIGPDDRPDGFDDEAIRLLLRAVFVAADRILGNP